MVEIQAYRGLRTTHWIPTKGSGPFSYAMTEQPAWVSVNAMGNLTIDCPANQVDPVEFGLAAANACGMSWSRARVIPVAAPTVAPRGPTVGNFALKMALDADGLRGLKPEYQWDRFHPINGEPQYFTYLGDCGGSQQGSSWVYGKAPFNIDPHQRIDDYIALTANVSPPGLRPLMLNQGYTSGVLTTADSMLLEYGFWEWEARMSAGPGKWGALWLGTLDMPPEFDFEFDGGKPTQVWLNGHVPTADPNTYSTPWNTDTWTTLPNGGRIDQWHTYGMHRMPSAFHWYIDGELVWTNGVITHPVDNRVYALMNLALSNSTGFISNLPANPAMPTSFDIRALRIWQTS